MQRIKNKIAQIDYKKILKSSFVKNSSYMVFSTIGMQLIAIATIPVLSRLFSPEAFGIHGTFRSTILIISILLTLALELAVILPKKEEEKNNIYLTTLSLITTISLILLVLFLLSYVIFKINLVNILFKNSKFSFVFLILLGSILVAITNLNQARLVSIKKFKNIAVSRFILPVFFFIFSLIFYKISFNYNGLIYAQIIAYLLLFLYLQKFIPINLKGFNKKIATNVIKKYKEMPLYTLPNSLLNTISLNLPLIVLGVLYSDTIVGFYAIGIKLVSLPVKFISSSFSQIFYKKATDTYNRDVTKLYPLVKKIMFSLLFIGIIVFTLAYILIPYLVPFFLGDQWIDSIKYLQYICFWQALMIVNGPISTITIILKKQKKLLLFQILFLISRTFALWYPFYLKLGAEYSVLFYALTGVLFNLYLFYFLLNISKNTTENLYTIN